MNKKELIKKYAGENKYFSLDGVVARTNLGRQTAVKYLHELKTAKVIYPAGRGIYTTFSEEFKQPQNSRVLNVRRIIRKSFPNLDFLVWNTLCLQTYYHHQQTHGITFVEVESEGVYPVADRLKRDYKQVFVENKSKTAPPGFDITYDPLIVKRLITRSPRNGTAPRLEKMLIDLYIIRDKYATMSEIDYWEMVRAVFSSYRINLSEMVYYAITRRGLHGPLQKIIENTGLKEVINGSKSGLLSLITRGKSKSE